MYLDEFVDCTQLELSTYTEFNNISSKLFNFFICFTLYQLNAWKRNCLKEYLKQR